MRMLALVFILLAVSAPAFAQTTSGAASSVNVSNPAYTSSNATTRLITPPTVVAPGLAAAGIETCLGSAVGWGFGDGHRPDLRQDDSRRGL